MMKGLSLLVGFAVATAVALPPVWAQEGEGKAVKAKHEKAKAEGKADKKVEGAEPFGENAGHGEKGKDARRSAFGEDLAAIDAACQLTDDEKKKLGTLKEARDKDLEKYDKAAEPRVTKAQEQLQKLSGMDAKKDRRVADAKKELEGGLAAIQTGRDQITDGYEKKMFAVLTPEQKAKWNAPILKDELMKEFSLVFLEAKQEERIDSLSQTTAKRLSVPLDPVKHEKNIADIKGQVYKTVLTAKQQEEYRKIKLSTGAKTKGEGKRG